MGPYVGPMWGPMWALCGPCHIIVWTMFSSVKAATQPETPFFQMFFLLFGESLAILLCTTSVQCASRKSRSAAGAHGGPMGPRAQNHYFNLFFLSKRAGRHPTGTGEP